MKSQIGDLPLKPAAYPRFVRSLKPMSPSTVQSKQIRKVQYKQIRRVWYNEFKQMRRVQYNESVQIRRVLYNLNKCEKYCTF